LENEEHLVLMNVKEDGEYNRERIIKEWLNYRCDKEMFKAIVRDIHLIINKYEDEQK
jgi:hypothetical protein